MTTTQKTRQYERIAAHGDNLLAIFPNALERDPIALCKKLRRLEAAGHVFALRLCNGPQYSTETAQEKDAQDILDKVNALLGNRMTRRSVPIFLNRDPRGYALKIDDTWMREHGNATDHPGKSPTAVCRLHRDWGGYGILAPEITGRD